MSTAIKLDSTAPQGVSGLLEFAKNVEVRAIILSLCRCSVAINLTAVNLNLSVKLLP